MASGELSMITTPAQGNLLPADVEWCADNGCFGKGYPGDDLWIAWLESFTKEQISRCRFATAPDVVGDAVATLSRSLPVLSRVRSLGYPVAFVAQDGIENTEIPWDGFDAIFIGGTTPFKLGPVAAGVVRQAKERGKWAHMGRVNSLRRTVYADAIGCDSVDGTALIYKPTERLSDVLSWLRKVNTQTKLEILT